MLRSMAGRGGVLRRITPRELNRRTPYYTNQCQRILPMTLRTLQPVQRRDFHSTRSNQGAPFVPILIAALKSSTALEVARTIIRLATSLMPFLFFSSQRKRRKLDRAKEKGVDHPKQFILLKRIQQYNFLLRIMVTLPSLLFIATILASLERTPLTGRWRMILMSPEEEEEVAAQLAGSGWYHAVTDILQSEGQTKLVHPNDWRYQWVRDTLRDLEQSIPILLRENELCPDWYIQSNPDDHVLPPPTQYPLRPRPRASEYIRAMAERMCERSCSPPPHNISGPPYSLLIVEDPTALNAFSYGFGPDGAGGIVVYTGFLDDILRRIPSLPTKQQQQQQSTSWWGSLTTSPPRRSPSLEQTSELAILLAHELSHLILSHHLESVSSAKVIIPGVLSIVTDIIRVMLFPVTIAFGPFASDAVSNVAKMGTLELEKAGEHCTSMAQEMEADKVSVRLLAHAGYNAQSAIRFWEQRQSCETLDTEHEGSLGSSTESSITGRIPRWMRGALHPISVIRVDSLKKELTRWEIEKLARLKMEKLMALGEDVGSSVNLLTV